jgi:hypothetical protein
MSVSNLAVASRIVELISSRLHYHGSATYGSDADREAARQLFAALPPLRAGWVAALMLTPLRWTPRQIDECRDCLRAWAESVPDTETGDTFPAGELMRLPDEDA